MCVPVQGLIDLLYPFLPNLKVFVQDMGLEATPSMRAAPKLFDYLGRTVIQDAADGPGREVPQTTPRTRCCCAPPPSGTGLSRPRGARGGSHAAHFCFLVLIGRAGGCQLRCWAQTQLPETVAVAHHEG